MVRTGFYLGGLGLLLVCTAAQASVIMSHCTDGASLYAWAKGGYLGTDSTSADFASASSRLSVLPMDDPPSFTRARRTVLPHFSTSVHDRVTVISRSHFVFDPASASPTSDEVTLVAKATGGSHDAHNSADNCAKARIWAVASLRFNIDVPDHGRPDAPVAYFSVGRLRPLDAYGTLSQATVFEDGRAVKRTSAGDKGFRVPLMFDREYELQLKYVGTVPYNDCPDLCVDQRHDAPPHPLGASVKATIIAMPEPGALGGAACAWLLLARRGRRSGKA